jgi:hypothetical protein
LVQEDIRKHLGKWLAQEKLGRPLLVYELELRERLIR